LSAITTYPLNGIDYDARDAAGYNATRTSGVYSAEEDFAVTPVGGVKVTVSAGHGWVRPARFEGYSIIMREAETLTLALADGQRPRIDRIVLRFDAASRKSSLLILQGTPDTQPTAPVISRTATVYDLCLAEVTRPAGSTAITAGNITDTRLDESLCGIMRDAVTRIPTDQLLKAAQARINALEEKATNSANAAAKSQSAAASSQSAAASSARAAKASESNAASSASAAEASETNAAASAEAAEASKTTAVKAEENAAKSAASAKEQADRAAAIVSTDKTLRIDGAPADAQAVGGELDELMSMLVTGRLTFGLYTDAGAVLCTSDAAQLTAEKHI
jgi:hypothetical protein